MTTGGHDPRRSSTRAAWVLVAGVLVAGVLIAKSYLDEPGATLGLAGLLPLVLGVLLVAVLLGATLRDRHPGAGDARPGGGRREHEEDDEGEEDEPRVRRDPHRWRNL